MGIDFAPGYRRLARGEGSRHGPLATQWSLAPTSLLVFSVVYCSELFIRRTVGESPLVSGSAPAPAPATFPPQAFEILLKDLEEGFAKFEEDLINYTTSEAWVRMSRGARSSSSRGVAPSSTRP